MTLARKVTLDRQGLIKHSTRNGKELNFNGSSVCRVFTADELA